MSNSTTNSKYYHGIPCRKYGHTLRYKSTGTCVVCVREHARRWGKENKERKAESGRQWTENNREKTRESNRRWRKNNPESERKAQARYYATNRSKKLDSGRRWTSENREKKTERGRQWRKENQEKARAIKHRRRAKKRMAVSEPYDFKAICEHYNNRCVKCGELKPLTVDHIKPISKGGPDIASNIQPLCQACNSTKWTKNIDYRPDAGPLRWIQNKLFGGK